MYLPNVLFFKLCQYNEYMYFVVVVVKNFGIKCRHNLLKASTASSVCLLVCLLSFNLLKLQQSFQVPFFCALG